MKKYILSLALLSLVAFCCINWKKAEEPAPKSALVMYGEAVYQREKCSRCHTQRVDRANKKLLSLDGFGGTYPNSWIYYYLNDPATMMPGSKSPAYPHLHDKYYDNKILNSIINNNQLTLSKDSLLRVIEQQAEAIAENLRNENLHPKQSEILALIAYLQQIPASPNKAKYDSIAFVKLYGDTFQQGPVWENVVLDSASIVFQKAIAPESIEKGKALFMMNCAVCHGLQAGGGVGPNLTDAYWLHGPAPLQIANTIVFGVPEKGMISWKDRFSPAEVGELVAFIQSVRGSHPEIAKDPQGVLYK